MDLLQKLIGDIHLKTTGKWLLLSVMIGIASGLGAIVFQFLGQAIQHYTLVRMAGFHAGEAAGEHSFFTADNAALSPGILLIVMAAGGLISGWLVFTYAPEAEGHGTDAAIDAFHNKRGEIRLRTPIIKTIASAVTLGTGGSAGREGPIAQIGAGFGSFLATRLRLSARDRRVMMAAGMGAGVGAIFRAPLAGALFAGEILYREADLEADVIVPSAVSSSIAFSVYSLSMPIGSRFLPLFGRDVQFSVGSFFELIPYSVLSLVLVAAGILYIKTFYGIHAAFKKLPIPVKLRPMVGAVLAGLTGLTLHHYLVDPDALAVLGSGYGTLQKTFGKAVTLDVSLLLAVALCKILTTSFTISSGGSGGVFGPSMVIGGCLGAAVGIGFHEHWPNLVPQPQAFAIVGMAGFFAGCARAPFSTILMVTEMTGDYRLLLPTMWVSTLCFLLNPLTLYRKQVGSRLDSPAHRGDFLVDVLEGIRVEDVYQKNRKMIMVHEGTSLDDIVHMLARTSQRYFPVVDDQQRMIGIFSADDVRSYLYDDTIWQVANAGDVMIHRVVTVTPEDDLNSALTSFTALNVDELPVVDPQQGGKLVGMLRRKESIAAYNRRLMEHKRAARD